MRAGRGRTGQRGRGWGGLSLAGNALWDSHVRRIGTWAAMALPPISFRSFFGIPSLLAPTPPASLLIHLPQVCVPEGGRQGRGGCAPQQGADAHCGPRAQGGAAGCGTLDGGGAARCLRSLHGVDACAACMGGCSCSLRWAWEAGHVREKGATELKVCPAPPRPPYPAPRPTSPRWARWCCPSPSSCSSSSTWWPAR